MSTPRGAGSHKWVKIIIVAIPIGLSTRASSPEVVEMLKDGKSDKPLIHIIHKRLADEKKYLPSVAIFFSILIAF